MKIKKGSLVKTNEGYICSINNYDETRGKYILVPLKRIGNERLCLRNDEFSLMYIKEHSNWLFNCDEEMNRDLMILKTTFSELGFSFSSKECCNIWGAYSEMLSANWLDVDNTNIDFKSKCKDALYIICNNSYYADIVKNKGTIVLTAYISNISDNRKLVHVNLIEESYDLDTLKLSIKKPISYNFKNQSLISFRVKISDIKNFKNTITPINFNKVDEKEF